MTRRKSAYLKWTLVLLVVILCPSVYTRPQETSVKTEIATESSIRYSYGNDSVRFSNLPLVMSFVQNSSKSNVGKLHDNRNRIDRMIKGIASNVPQNKINRNKRKPLNKRPTTVKLPELSVSYEKRRPNIKKVLTKWKDEAKYEDLNFSYEATSDERDPITTVSVKHTDDSSTESINFEASVKNRQGAFYNHYRPYQPTHSEEAQLYSTNIQIVDSYTPRPTYLHTKRPSPTPIITNVGYPSQWQQNSQIRRKTTTQKPVRVTHPLNYNYHNSIHNYPGEFEVTTFQPTSAYTERIVIRPEEYSGSPDECPTIYLTLNNTFQGQAKESCPDLNIAVNTNVINKNVVIESEEEEETDSLFPGTFGLPLGDDDSNPDPDESATNDYFGGDSVENVSESDSLEGTELSNYNAANGLSGENIESGGLFSPSNQLSAISRPGRPSKDDDDIFSFSSLVEFFRPAVNILGWLVSFSPFPLFFAPIALMFAGSGLAALFSPLIFPIGREAPKYVHVYRPYWHWDDTIKTWHLHSFPDNRNSQYSARSSKEDIQKSSVKPTLFYKLKEIMKQATGILRENNKIGNNRKSKKRKRDVWSIRVK